MKNHNIIWNQAKCTVSVDTMHRNCKFYVEVNEKIFYSRSIKIVMKHEIIWNQQSVHLMHRNCKLNEKIFPEGGWLSCARQLRASPRLVPAAVGSHSLCMKINQSVSLSLSHLPLSLCRRDRARWKLQVGNSLHDSGYWCGGCEQQTRAQQ